METKKNARANLENKRFRFFQLGLIMTLSFSLLAFEWKSEDEAVGISRMPVDDLISLEKEEAIDYTTKVVRPKPKVFSNNTFTVSEDLTLEDVVKKMTENVKKTTLEEILLEDEEEELDGLGGFIPASQEMPYFDACWDLNKRVQEMCTREKIEEFIRTNQNFPKYLGINGSFDVVFYIGKKGEILKTEITNSIHPKYDEEAIRLVKSLPKFEPGKQGGRPTVVRYKLPIVVKG